MSPPRSARFVVGVDGCPAGWVAVKLDARARWEVSVLPNALAVWEMFRDAALVLIDVPIGLPESTPRACDLAARRFLGRRGMTVFATPCRAAIEADSYEAASRINEERTGARISKQTWNIVPKIREVDDLLRDEPGARGRLREMHPEVCFAALAGGPIADGKATPEGEARRIEVLEAAGLPARAILAAALAGRRRRELAEDDVLDAMVGAVTAAAAPAGIVTMPAEPEHDARGLAMEIVHAARPLAPPPPAGADAAGG